MNAFPLAARALACAGATALCLAALPFAHGGTYRGPGDTVPPGGGGGSGGGGPPTQPGPGPGGGNGPGGPVTGPGTVPGGPGGPPGSGPRTTGSGEDLTDWTYWWEFNKEPYLLLKDAVLRARPTTGSDEWFLSQRARADSRDVELFLTEDQRRAIEEALLAALSEESHQDVVTGCLMALAKMGEVKDESGRSRFEEAFLPHLKSNSQEVVETTALALGILAHPSSAPALAHLLRDDAAGRELVAETEVPLRTRAFAAYGLALLGARVPDEEVKRSIAEHLVAALESDASATRDVQVACLIALGLVPLQPIEPPAAGAAAAPAASRIGQIEFLQAYLRDEKRPELVRAHAPVALTRLIADLPPELHARYHDGIAEGLLRSLDPRSRAGDFVRQSAVQALGLLGDSDQDPLDARIRDRLIASAKDGPGAQERCFALIALAQVGGRAGQGAAPAEDEVTRHLVSTLTRGSGPLRPWAGVAVGVRGAALRQADGTPPKEATTALLTRLVEERSASSLGAYAIGAGLLGDPAAKMVLRERLLGESEDLARGYMAVALGLLRDTTAVEPIQRVLHESKYRPELLNQAAVALGLLGDKETVPALIEMLRKSDTLSAQAALASALGTIGDARSVDALLALLRSDASATARGFAAAALGLVADRERLPWNTALSVDLNYRASTATLNDLEGNGVLNIL